VQDFEKLGVFYLGRLYDAERKRVTDEPLLYDAKDLTTHAVCVGMTGSGKTGLCVSLLEEAAIDGIPAIAIDPKGDLSNLLLAFPELRPQDFRPWIDEAEAQRQGRSPDEQAARTAEAWRKGLADWGQDPARIARFCDAAERVIYTPGSNAGRPLRVLRSFAAPAGELAKNEEALRDRVAGVASSLLSLLGLDGDPLRSREHILLSNILDRAWREGRDLEIASLIREIQSPPFDRVGVLDLESFFPSKDRFDLAMRLNNLLAAPGAAVWMEGDPLDVGSLLHGPSGKPKLSIVSIAHLSDSERMFFVTLLLNEVLAWMRAQSGTSSLRALLYMDEVFGYFPPTANPPAKTPMLTLLKQARAYGLGVVLATQNPVDLDYKGLSNAGTWFIGRLQTERDKARVLDGLEGASAAGGKTFDRATTERVLSGLDSRVFLMNNVHDDGPVLFQSRWALSYLGGPLTRAQIQRLTGGEAATPPTDAKQPPAAAPAAPASERPVVEPGVPERFAAVRGAPSPGESLLYKPVLYGSAKLHYTDRRSGLDHWQTVRLVTPLDGEVGADPWASAESREAEIAVAPSPDSGAGFAALPTAAARAKSFAAWQKQLADHLYRDCPLVLWHCAESESASTPGESESAFRARLAHALREKRDLDLERQRQKYAPKIERLRERIRAAQDRVAREQSQATQSQLHTAVSIGATLVGAIFGRRSFSATTMGRAASAARSAARASRERDDVARATDKVEDLQRELSELENEFSSDAGGVGKTVDPSTLALEEVRIAPRKADVQVEQVVLLWMPWIASPSGNLTPAC
jgi:phage host-nuclease inhibitor protein Gam